jgi:glycosyltransferase involved in cell wall biosynthesis
VIKILFTIPNFDTAGSGKALLNIAMGLDRNNFEPHIMCKHNRGTFFKTVKNSGIPVHLLEYETPMRPYTAGLLGCWKVSRIFKKIRPDIIHSFHYSADYSEPLAARLAGCKWVFTKKNMNWGRGSKNAWLLRSKLAAGIIAQNMEMIEKFYPKSKKTMLIPRGVNTNCFMRIATDESTSPKKSIVCVANLVPVKGVEVLIEAYQKISSGNTTGDWRLRIVGDDNNDYGNLLKRRYRHLIAENRLIFTGKVGDVRAELQTSSIFVLPTLNEGRMEGSPVSLLEAMSMGLPVIGSRIPGIMDQLEPLGDDHLFDPGKIEDLSHKLEKLMKLDESQMLKLNKRIREYCRQNWDISIEIKKHEQFYLKILGCE